MNASLIARNSGMKTIDVIEDRGMLPELVSIAAEIFADDML